MEKMNIDKNLYNEKTLNLLNIRELRDIGRKLCVPSPTTMKKNELVDYILKVVYGEVKPPCRTAVGRPSSREFDMNKYIDKIKKNSDQIEQIQGTRLDYNYYDENNNLVFKLAAAKESTDFVANTEQRVVFIDETGCYLRIRQFVASDNDIKVSDELVKRLKLENFDVVEVIITALGFRIVSINGQIIPNEIKRFEGEEFVLKAGMSKVFYLRTKEEIERKILHIKNNCKAQNLQLVSFGLEKYEEPFAVSFVLNNEDIASGKYKQLMMFMEHCKKLIYENKNFVVLIQDMNLIEEVIQSVDKVMVEIIKAHLNQQFDDIVSLGNLLIGIKPIKSLNY